MSQFQKPLGLYIHVPFCAHKCAYCDFYSITNEDLIQEYTAAITAHIRSRKNDAKNYTVDTVFFGGGTPSILTGGQMKTLMDAVFSSFSVGSSPSSSPSKAQ